MGNTELQLPGGEFLLYQTEDGRTRVECRFQEETIWLTQQQLAELFQTTTQNITTHLRNVYAEGELQEDSTCKHFLQVQLEGSRQVERNRKHYNLDAIISVGYRVNTLRGTQFRIWATPGNDRPVDTDFDLATRQLQKLPKPKKPGKDDQP